MSSILGLIRILAVGAILWALYRYASFAFPL